MPPAPRAARAFGASEFLPCAHGTHAVYLDEALSSDRLPADRSLSRHAVASVLVLADDGAVLLARNRSGGWGTVGGHIEPQDTTLRQAAVRELFEETGIEAGAHRLRPLVLLVDGAEFRPGHAHADFCFVLPVSGRPVAVAGDDVSELRWFPLEALPELNDHMALAVAALRS